MFRDEDLAYARRPRPAGVPAEFHLHPGAPHESDFIAFNTTAARRAIADLDGPEWIDPAADHHRDLTALTAAVRGELDRAVRKGQRHVRRGRQALLQRLTRLPREMPDSLRQSAQARHRDAALASNVGRRRHP